MLRSLVCIGISLVSFSAEAARFIVQDPCSSAVWLDTTAVAKPGDTVGAATVATLKAHDLPFIGTERGINVIGDTPVGDGALEIINNQEMRAYGWCYSVNGVNPDVYPDQFAVKSDLDTIEWFYGFAYYLAGTWTSYCNPTSVERPSHICQ